MSLSCLIRNCRINGGWISCVTVISLEPGVYPWFCTALTIGSGKPNRLVSLILFPLNF